MIIQSEEKIVLQYSKVVAGGTGEPSILEGSYKVPPGILSAL